MATLSDHFDLTERELQLLLMYADGLSRPEIAEELVIAVETVATHTFRMKRKLQAKTVAHAVALAYHKGILLIPKQ